MARRHDASRCVRSNPFAGTVSLRRHHLQTLPHLLELGQRSGALGAVGRWHQLLERDHEAHADFCNLLGPNVFIGQVHPQLVCLMYRDKAVKSLNNVSEARVRHDDLTSIMLLCFVVFELTQKLWRS